MFNRKTRAAAAALALTAAAFGSVATVAPATAAPSVVRTNAPGVDELQSKLQLALNTGAPRGDRAAELEAGEAGLPVVDELSNRMAAIPSFRYSVIGPVSTQGDLTTAQLKLALDGYEDFPAVEVAWRQIDGTWKLTNDSLCGLAYYGSVPCSL
ncbi:hypothetical protein [Nocardia cyriacigeorgica]|uniref:hypothetical protein n=1 Tax=Nocardia cyriacigeorgica TaxID=135487 RepID=UPI0024558659|nr:hypothetical protein [Nocardia cyriacigeorgica]